LDGEANPPERSLSMQLSSVRIQNLRSCSDVKVQFGAYTCLVGANGAGKSNILCALNIFFRQSENTSTDFSQLVEEDFHKKNR
jgi:predicted ATP-dependent endonuclease of OLD family